MEPVVSSFRIDVDAGACSQPELAERLSRCLSSVVSALRDAGCPLIGHIKLMLSGEQKGYLVANVTSFDEPPSVRGQLEGKAGKGHLTVHAVVYGVGGVLLERILRRSLRDLIPSPS